MDIKLKEIKLNQQNILENLLQLYLHNLSLDFPIEFDSNVGKYKYDDINKYFESKNNKAFFIYYQNELAGFVLIDLFKELNVIQELFILNNYKRRGIGKIAINKVFDQFKGNWEIKTVPCSKSAESFWQNVVSEYTKGNFNLEHVGKYNRAIFTFKN